MQRRESELYCFSSGNNRPIYRRSRSSVYGRKTSALEGLVSNEKVAAVILILVLAVFLVLFGLILYEPPTGPGLCGAFGPEPCPGREALYIISATVNSPTDMTAQIVNTGTVTISLTSYNVRNTYSQPYGSADWSGPNVAPNAYANITLVIDGNAFTFHSGSYYTITLITARNNQFTSTIKA